MNTPQPLNSSEFRNISMDIVGGIMRATNSLILNTVKDVVGEHAVPIVDFLRNRKNISEFKIAEKTNMDIHIVRNVLYNLHGHNLATYHRKKDRQKGWYISYWTFNSKRIKDLVLKLKNNKLEKLKERLIKEEGNHDNFFMCKNACTRLDFDHATDFEYKCPECGQLLNQMDNSRTIENIKLNIKELEKGLKRGG